MIPFVATGINNALFMSWPKSISNPETIITRIIEPPKTTASFQR